MKYRKKERGQSLLEFALILPVLLIILAGILDLGRLYFAYVAVTDAAGEGAAYGAIHPNDEEKIKDRTQDASGGLVEIDRNLITVVRGSQAVTVTVSYEFTLATPLISTILPDGMLMLNAVAIEHKVTSD